MTMPQFPPFPPDWLKEFNRAAEELRRLTEAPLVRLNEELGRIQNFMPHTSIAEILQGPKRMAEELSRIKEVSAGPDLDRSLREALRAATYYRDMSAQVFGARQDFMKTMSRQVAEALNSHSLREISVAAEITGSISNAFAEATRARVYLETTNFDSIRALVGHPVGLALEKRLSKAADLFDKYLFSALPKVYRLPEQQGLHLSRNLDVSSAAYEGSSQSAFCLAIEAEEEFFPIEPDRRLVSLLNGIDPALTEMYSGAISAYNMRTPDRSRHVGVSLRELLREIIEQFSPSEDTKKWIVELTGQLPKTVTIRNRIQYVWQSQATSEIRFVGEQIATIYSLSEALNKPTHKRQFDETGSLRGYIHSVEGALLLILENRKPPA